MAVNWHEAAAKASRNVAFIRNTWLASMVKMKAKAEKQLRRRQPAVEEIG